MMGMIETSPEFLASVIGTYAGIFAVGMAVYLQVFYTGHAPVKYVSGFFILGAGLILANVTGAVWSVGIWADWLPVVGNLLIAVAILYGCWHVIRVIDAQAAYDESLASSD